MWPNEATLRIIPTATGHQRTGPLALTPRHRTPRYPLSLLHQAPRFVAPTTITMSAPLATKQESLKIFEQLKKKTPNKVSRPAKHLHRLHASPGASIAHHSLLPRRRHALTAARTTRRGPRSRSASTSASTAPQTTATWACTSRLCAPRTSTVSPSLENRGLPRFVDAQRAPNGPGLS